MGKNVGLSIMGFVVCRLLIVKTGRQSVLYILATWPDVGLLI